MIERYYFIEGTYTVFIEEDKDVFKVEKKLDSYHPLMCILDYL